MKRCCERHIWNPLPGGAVLRTRGEGRPVGKHLLPSRHAVVGHVVAHALAAAAAVAAAAADILLAADGRRVGAVCGSSSIQ